MSSVSTSCRISYLTYLKIMRIYQTLLIAALYNHRLIFNLALCHVYSIILQRPQDHPKERARAKGKNQQHLIQLQLPLRNKMTRTALMILTILSANTCMKEKPSQGPVPGSSVYLKLLRSVGRIGVIGKLMVLL